MKRKNLEIIFAVISFTMSLQGCSQPASSNTTINAESNQSAAPSNINSGSTYANTSNSSEVNNKVAQNANSGSTSNKKQTAPGNFPTPKVTSGGNDLLIFNQVRNQISSDKDLIKTVIIEVKEGNVILTGKVLNEEQKKKAEQLVQSVQGVKSVKNDLRVSP